MATPTATKFRKRGFPWWNFSMILSEYKYLQPMGWEPLNALQGCDFFTISMVDGYETCPIRKSAESFPHSGGAERTIDPRDHMESSNARDRGGASCRNTYWNDSSIRFEPRRMWWFWYIHLQKYYIIISENKKVHLPNGAVLFFSRSRMSVLGNVYLYLHERTNGGESFRTFLWCLVFMCPKCTVDIPV